MTDYAKRMIWKLGILPVLDEVVNGIPDNVINEYHVTRVPDSELQKRFFQTYEESRKYMKTHFFDMGMDDDNLIDFHKVCSCIVNSLAKNRFLEYDLREDISINLLSSNYTAAFLAGTRCLFILCVARLQKEGEIEKVRCLWKRGRFEFPNTGKGHDSYIIGKAKALGLNETYHRDFDYLAYADILFWIEKYNVYRIIGTAAEDKVLSGIAAIQAV